MIRNSNNSDPDTRFRERPVNFKGVEICVIGKQQQKLPEQLQSLKVKKTDLPEDSFNSSQLGASFILLESI